MAMASIFDLTPKRFSAIIEDLAVKLRMSRFDAIIHYCETNDFEEETAAKLLTSQLKETIKQEQISLNNLKTKRIKAAE